MNLPLLIARGQYKQHLPMPGKGRIWPWVRGLEGAQGKEGSRGSLQDRAGKWGEQAAPGWE